MNDKVEAWSDDCGQRLAQTMVEQEQQGWGVALTDVWALVAHVLAVVSPEADGKPGAGNIGLRR